MVKVNVYNTSTKAQISWADIVIPYSVAKDLPAICKYKGSDNSERIAIKGRSMGDETTLFHVRGGWMPGSTEGSIEPYEPDASFDSVYKEFKMSDWVGQDPLRLIPQPILMIAGEEHKPGISGNSTLISINNALAVFYVRFESVLGYNTECFIKVYSHQDSVEFSWNCYYSNPNSPTYEAPRLTELRVSSRSPFVIHWAKEKNITAPTDPDTDFYSYVRIGMNGTQIGYIPQFDTWEYTLLRNQDFREGQGCEITGYILALPSSFMDAIAHNPLDQFRVEYLEGVKLGDLKFGGVGEVRGVAKDMNPNGEWSVFGRTPENIQKPYTYPNPFYTNGMFGMRRIGMAAGPGQTGGQEDFGSEKGSAAVTLGEPQWITYYRAVLTDMYRYFHIDDLGGDMVRAINHPRWTTWNMETHDQTTGDTLGKTKYAIRPNGNGWRGYDNEHRSQNGILAWFALTGDYMIEKMIHRCIENEAAQVKNRAGAEREVGRLLITYTKMYKLVDGYYKSIILSAMNQKLNTVKTQWRGRFFQNDPSKTVRVLQVIKDLRSNVYDANGNLDFAWIPYQTALMIVGMYAAAKTLKRYRTEAEAQEILDICKQLCYTLVNHGIFKDPNADWKILTFCAYRTATPQISGWIQPNQPAPEEGLPITEAEYMDPRRVTYGNSFIDWTGPAIAIARHICDDQPTIDRANDFINYFYPNGLQNWDAAEWWACAPVKTA